MFDDIAAQFADSAPTPKGRRVLRTVFEAMRATVAADGIDAASLERIAHKAGLSQAALRHYFPTRYALVSRFFTSGADWYRANLEARLASGSAQPRQQIEDCLRWHLDFIVDVDAGLWFESSAFWLRDARGRKARDTWYTWLTTRYAELIGQARPELGHDECRRRAFAAWTLILGSWVTHGRGSALRHGLPAAERREILIATAMRIACD